MFDYAAAGEEIGRKIRRSGRRRTLLLLNEKTNSSIEALTANMSEHVTTFAFRTPLFRMAARVKQRDFALFDTIRERLLKELEACELLPFRLAISAGIPAIMTSHVLFPALETGVVPDGQALALALHPGSLDGRYLGLVPLASLRRAEPLAAF